jgi:hypothetical protein
MTEDFCARSCVLFSEARGETVWKIAVGLASVLLGRQKAPNRGSFGPTLRPLEPLFRNPSRFSRQFRKGYSAKFKFVSNGVLRSSFSGITKEC